MNILYINRLGRKNIIIFSTFLIVSLILIVNYYVSRHKRVIIPAAEVKKGEIIITQTETGEVRASKNQTITAPATSRGMGNLMIIDMIPEGTTVEKSDLLIQFDTQGIEDLIERRDELLHAKWDPVIQDVYDL